MTSAGGGFGGGSDGPRDPFGGAPFAGDPWAPPPQPPGAPPPPKARGKALALGGVAVAVVGVVALVSWLVFGGTDDGTADTAGTTTASSAAPSSAGGTTSAPPPPPPKVVAAGLPALALGLDELKQITENPELANAGATAQIEAPPPTVATFEPAECMSSFGTQLPPAYDNSGYQAVYAKNHIQQPTPSMQVAEGLATFADAAAAQTALDRYIGLWRECAGKRFTWTHVAQGEFSMWTLGAPEDAGGGVTTLRSINDASPVSVTRAIAAKNNVLVDIWVIGSAVSDDAATIAQRILARIPG